MRAILAALAASLTLATPVAALETSAGRVEITRVADGLDEPWALAFLPEGGFLVTLRAGVLRHYRADGSHVEVAGLPAVAASGQGGLLDVMLPRDFAQSREVFLSFSSAQGRGAGTALGAGRLSEDGTRLEGFRTLFEMAAGSSGGRHFGSRIVEAADGTLFLTTGDRGDDASAQDLAGHQGKVIRLNRDGSVPADNPFVGQGDFRPEIWSWGHRNPQGATLDAEGRLWVSEHGARGGDEVNLVGPGLNYGWPAISYGRHYSGARIGVGTEAPGMEQPAHHWDPSIAPSGHMVYSGRLWPEWQGHHFLGSLNSDFVSRLDPGTPAATGWAEERLIAPETLRVRDIREAPDGSIWFLSVGRGAVYRIAPAEGA